MSTSRQNKNTKHAKDGYLHVRLQRESFRKHSSEITEEDWDALTDGQKVAIWAIAAGRTMNAWQKVAETLAKRLGDVEYAHTEYSKILDEYSKILEMEG